MKISCIKIDERRKKFIDEASYSDAIIYGLYSLANVCLEDTTMCKEIGSFKDRDLTFSAKGLLNVLQSLGEIENIIMLLAFGIGVEKANKPEIARISNLTPQRVGMTISELVEKIREQKNLNKFIVKYMLNQGSEEILEVEEQKLRRERLEKLRLIYTTTNDIIDVQKLELPKDEEVYLQKLRVNNIQQLKFFTTRHAKSYEKVPVAFTTMNFFETGKYIENPVRTLNDLMDKLPEGTRKNASPALKRADVTSLSKLLNLSQAELAFIPRLGPKSINTIVHILKDHGVHLA